MLNAHTVNRFEPSTWVNSSFGISADKFGKERQRLAGNVFIAEGKHSLLKPKVF